MSRRVKTPTNQKRLTNVVIVRLKRGGQRFEVAAYPNKVEEWKKKIETDIDEVLQATTVFENVSKGTVAKNPTLKKCFKTADHRKICLEILAHGEMQVSEKERKLNNKNQFKDIATIIVDKCIDPKTGRSPTVSMVESALKEIGASINTQKTAKAQALFFIKELKQKSSLSLERAKMRLLVTVPSSQSEVVSVIFAEVEQTIEDGDNVQITGLISPSKFREIDSSAKAVGGHLEVVTHSVKPESDVVLDGQGSGITPF